MKSILFLSLLFFAVRVFSTEIVLEVEDFKGKGRLWKKKYYSGKGILGKWKKLTQEAQISKSGKYYIWIRYTYNWQVWGKKNLRDFSLTVNGKKTIINKDVGRLGYLVIEDYLPAGKVKLELQKIGNDPFADVIIITDNPKFLPAKRNHIYKWKSVEDKIINKPVIFEDKKISIPQGEKPVIDGKLDDKAWETAVSTKGFRLISSGRKPILSTKVMLCHDSQKLYIAYKCSQDTKNLVSTDKVYDGDCIELAFSTSGNKYPIYHLIVNPAGKIYTEKIAADMTDSKWFPNDWKIATGVKNNNYNVEISIPLSSVIEKLSYEPKVWKANFCRSTVDRKESSTWNKTTGGYADPNGFGKLHFNGISNDDFALIYKPLLLKKLEFIGEKNLFPKINFEKAIKLESMIDQKLAKTLLPPSGKSFIFEGMNLIPNPGFEYGIVGQTGITPLNWYTNFPGKALLNRKKSNGRFALAISKTKGKYVLKANAKPLIDHSIKYRFSGYVRGEKLTGRNFIKVTWFVPDVSKSGWGGVKIGGISQSAEFNGSFDYRKFAFDCVPPKDAVQCSFAIHSYNNKGTLHLDDLEFDGMGATPVEIIIPQPGFDTHGNKQAVIFTKKTLKNNSFAVKIKDKIVFSGKLKSFGKSQFYRYAYIADFSSLKTQGTYSLGIKCNNRDYSSHDFKIKKNLYLDYAKLASNFYYIQRQGVDIPGWHKANFLDDAALWDPIKKKVVGHRDVSGGWQDAGDPSKQAQNDISIYALSLFFESYKPQWNKFKEKYPDILYLADLGARRWVNKLYNGNGRFLASAVNYCSKPRKIHGVNPANWTDNISGTWDDRIVINKSSIQWHISQLAKYALIIKDKNPAMAAKVTKMIEQNYAQRKNEKIVFYRARLKYDFLFTLVRHHGELLRNSMALYRLTGNNQYAEDSKRYAKLIAKVLKKKFYLKKAYFSKIDKYSMMRSFPFFISACFEYLERNKHKELENELKNYMQKVVIAFSKYNEFGVITGNRPQTKFVADGGVKNHIICAYGFAAAQAARRWKNPELLKVAENCVQWVSGRNPRNLSMLIGNGWKFAATSSTVAAYSPGHGDGVLPGAVIRGIRQQDGTPENYPAVNTSTNPGGLALSRYHEVYQVDVAMFMLACGEIQKAIQEFK